MLKLVRKGQEVFCEGVKLKMVTQASKGPNKEVVKIEGLEGSNGQTWISLSKLVEGENLVECKQRVVEKAMRYQLTVEEQQQVNEYQSKIDEIIEKAKKRFVEKPNLNVDITKMNDEEKLSHIEKVEKYLEYIKNIKKLNKMD